LFQPILLALAITDASMAPRDKLPDEFWVKLTPKRGYSRTAPPASLEKNGVEFKAVLFIDDRRGNPSPRMPLVWSFRVTLESVIRPNVRVSLD
jgi:hypothetical protein